MKRNPSTSGWLRQAAAFLVVTALLSAACAQNQTDIPAAAATNNPAPDADVGTGENTGNSFANDGGIGTPDSELSYVDETADAGELRDSDVNPAVRADPIVVENDENALPDVSSDPTQATAGETEEEADEPVSGDPTSEISPDDGAATPGFGGEVTLACADLELALIGVELGDVTLAVDKMTTAAGRSVSDAAMRSALDAVGAIAGESVVEGDIPKALTDAMAVCRQGGFDG